MARKKYLPVSVVGIIVVVVVILIGLFGHAEATEFTDRSLMVQTPAAGQVTDYTFTFGYSVASPLGSVTYEFCDMPLPLDPCVAPVGLDVQAASLTAQTGETGFSIVSQTSNTIVMGRTAQIPAAGPSMYTFSNVTNPTGDAQVVFVRLQSFSSNDGTGAFIDEGAVATSTTRDVEIYTQVPPVLIFCVATVINDTECADMSGNYHDAGELDATQTAALSVQMHARTNARSGYTIQMTGNSMASGIHTIPSVAVPTPSFVGVGQFGMNIAANTVPAIGTDPVGPGLNAIVNPSYTIPNQYLYNDGDVLVTSTNPTRDRKFTMSYIVNVPETQPLGVYTTTITYVCIGSF